MTDAGAGKTGREEGGLRSFPMQGGPAIPWCLAEEIYKVYSHLYGTSQSLERLAERGGFGWAEVEGMFTNKRAGELPRQIRSKPFSCDDLSALRSQHDALREAADGMEHAIRDLLHHGAVVTDRMTGESLPPHEADPQNAKEALARYESSKSAPKGGSDAKA